MLAALDPYKDQLVPADYAQWKLAKRLGIPPWVLDGEPANEPSLLWLIRVREYARMEGSTTVRRT